MSCNRGDCRQPPGAPPMGRSNRSPSMQAGAMARGSTYQVEPMIAQVMRCVFEKSRVLLLVYQGDFWCGEVVG